MAEFIRVSEFFGEPTLDILGREIIEATKTDIEYAKITDANDLQKEYSKAGPKSLLELPQISNPDGSLSRSWILARTVDPNIGIQSSFWSNITPKLLEADRLITQNKIIPQEILSFTGGDSTNVSKTLSPLMGNPITDKPFEQSNPVFENPVQKVYDVVAAVTLPPIEKAIDLIAPGFNIGESLKEQVPILIETPTNIILEEDLKKEPPSPPPVIDRFGRSIVRSQSDFSEFLSQNPQPKFQGSRPIAGTSYKREDGENPINVRF